jgi:hypothetical protein
MILTWRFIGFIPLMHAMMNIGGMLPNLGEFIARILENNVWENIG